MSINTQNSDLLENKVATYIYNRDTQIIGSLRVGVIYGLVAGFFLGNCNLFGLYNFKTWKNIFIFFNKSILNGMTGSSKKYYINGNIDSKILENFKEFMLKINENDDIHIFIDTNGGSFTSAQIISDIILSHKGETNAIILNKAFSAGTLIALSCNNLYMHKNAYLSPVDVQYGNFFETVQLTAVKNILENKNPDKINDNTFILADQADKCKALLDSIFVKIIEPKYHDEAVRLKIKSEIFDGQKYTHSTAFSRQHLQNIGVNVKPMSKSMEYLAQLKYD